MKVTDVFFNYDFLRDATVFCVTVFGGNLESYSQHFTFL
jgi:hypothetical protein